MKPPWAVKNPKKKRPPLTLPQLVGVLKFAQGLDELQVFLKRIDSYRLAGWYDDEQIQTAVEAIEYRAEALRLGYAQRGIKPYFELP